MSGWLRTTVVLSLLCMMAGNSYGQERSNPLAPGVWALQFSIAQDFTLSNFNGAMLAMKKHVSSKTAWRVGVTIGAGTQDREFSNSDSTRIENESDNYGALLSLELLKYLRPESPLSFFAGFGPVAGYDYAKSDDKSDSSEQEFKASLWSVGVNGILGAEWFLSQAVGVHAEYRLRAGYTSSSDTRKFEDQEAKSEANSWSIGSGGVRFGLSAYF
jgi:hypothetical protein